MKDNKTIKSVKFFRIPIFEKILEVQNSIFKDTIISYIYIYKVFNISVYKTNEKIKIYDNKVLDQFIDKLEDRKTNYWNQDFWMQKSIGEYINTSPDIQKNILDLCKDLDENSIDTVCKIIKRLKTLAIKKDYVVDYSKKEIDIQEEIKESFFGEIFKVDKESWCYKGYFLPIKKFEISVFWHKHGMNVFSEETINKIYNDNIIDVGGFIGDSAILFEKEFTSKNVYTFEATTKNYNLIMKTIALNDSKRIIPVKYALGSTESTLKIYNSGISSSFYENGEEKGEFEEVEIITLDSYIDKHNIRMGLIKVDVEGYEQEFLKGARATIEKYKPALIISIYHNSYDFFNIKKLIESWNLGYKFKIYKPVDFYISLETCLYCEIV